MVQLPPSGSALHTEQQNALYFFFFPRLLYSSVCLDRWWLDANGHI